MSEKKGDFIFDISVTMDSGNSERFQNSATDDKR